MLAAADRLTAPLPDPVPPELIVSQLALLDAVHEQAPGAVTLTDSCPPFAPTDCVAGKAVYVHVSAACEIVTVWPATVSVAERTLVVAFAATEYPTGPLPDPDAPDVIVIHPAFEAAIHAQPVPADTETEPVAPADTTDCVVGVTEKLQGWVNAKVFDTELVPAPPGPTAMTRAS